MHRGPLTCLAFAVTVLVVSRAPANPEGSKPSTDSELRGSGDGQKPPTQGEDGRLRQWWEQEKEQSRERRQDLSDRYQRWKDKWFGEGSDPTGGEPDADEHPRSKGKGAGSSGPERDPLARPSEGPTAIDQDGSKAIQKAIGDISLFDDPHKRKELEMTLPPSKGGDAAAAAGPGGGSGGRQAQEWLRGADTFAADPADPKTEADFLMAAMSGFKAPFDRLGLRAVPGGDPPVQRKDGSPASRQDLEALRAAIKAEPQALMKYPDFFSVLPREAFRNLKVEYRSSEEARRDGFKHVGLTVDERDFKWSQSCSKVSGTCNQNVGAVAYRAGTFVPPDDLKRIWENQAQQRLGIGAEEAHAKLSRRLFSDSDKAGLFSSLFGLADSVKNWFSGEEAGVPAGKGAGPGGGEGPGEAAVEAAAGTGGPTAAGVRPGRPREADDDALDLATGTAPGPGPAKPHRRLWPLAALLGAALIGVGFYRNRER